MIAIPYGKGHLDVTFPYNGLLTSRVDELKSDRTGRELVEEAMASPIGTPGLAALLDDGCRSSRAFSRNLGDFGILNFFCHNISIPD